ncbi:MULTISPECIES: HlyD family secretion protein [Halomonadaceae]|jgi:membrane fusion protein (multidrug efflux system)|uniref:HlyD family secretion protein n=1 Tax=Halomonadaceae TaxID=28256 RepID=UPI0015829B7F|nr:MULTISPECIES: HlyD family secretion protein [Halomonas]MDI4639156.1 HlyD family secretion protein [Halomonas sp. BMC7]NUJ60148.1 HlyD family secretion protein [Halomonas taeanensis]|tara:strand:+ start:6342 stop:7499 length:1158 start_codon:yes stop_codon:yes gene_type:complete
MTSLTSNAAPRRPGKGTKLALLAVALLACALWAGVAIYHRMSHVSAQDARVMANQVTVSSRLAGWVTDFTVIEGDHLDKGAIVAKLYSQPDEQELETRQAGVAVMQARVDYQQQRLEVAERQLEGGKSLTHQELSASQAAMQAAQARLVQARKDFQRSDALLAKHSVSQQQRDEDYYAYQAAQAEYHHAQQEVAVSQALADNAEVGFINGSQMPLPNPSVQHSQLRVARQALSEARARLEQTKQHIADLQVPSPVSGVVNKTFIDQGEYVSPGQPILMMHDPAKLWVEANIKETDISELRVDQPVAIAVDAFPDQTFSGHITTIGRAATSQFALLPDPNPSGNFTKITQRLPVRIAFDEGPIDLIGPGMMVNVEIDVSGAGPRHG